MPEAQVRGVTLNYEIIGDHGPFIALTPGSRRSYDEFVPLARLLGQRRLSGAAARSPQLRPL